MNILAAIFAAVAIALIGLMFFRYFSAIRRVPDGTPRGRSAERRLPVRFPPIHRCTRLDALLMAAITLVYGLVGFSNLGDTSAPQTFYRLTEISPSVTIDLGSTQTLRGIFYYTGSFHDPYGNFKGYDLELSLDGETYFSYGQLGQTHANTFHWVNREFSAEDITEYGVPTARYIRITAGYFPMELGELCILDADGAPIDPAPFKSSPIDAAARLFDEQSLMPEESSYRNSMYFDEIYHARTAREFLNGDRVYENTHPPLGKSILSVGIALFGMTPFGWRFMGVLFGVLMLPFAYALTKNMLGKTWLSACATLIFAFDFMHYVQTRIATIDTYGLFFTILMYFFMYRFLAAGYDAPARTRLVPLALCGVSFGLGIASKWTCFYAAAGLVVLYVIGAVLEGRRLCSEDRKAEFWKKFGVVVALSVLFFVVVGFGIYYLSYIPFCRSKGEQLNFATVWANQTSMFNYHSGLEATHSYQSSWWQWLIDGRPILYFRNYSDYSTASFSSFNNPLLAWAGLLAMTTLIAGLYRGGSRWLKYVGILWAVTAALGFAAQVVTFILSDYKQFTNQLFSYVFAIGVLGGVVTPFLDRGRRVQISHNALFIIIGALAQLLAWIPVTRCTFAYHYFPTSFFLVLAIAFVFHRWEETERQLGAPQRPVLPFGIGAKFGWNLGSGARRTCVIFTAACVLLFALYYPVLTGLYAPNWYCSLLKWFPSWPI